VAGGVNVYAAHIQQRNVYYRQAAAVKRLRSHPVLAWARRVRDRRWARIVSWPVRRVAPGALRRLLGP
jgi:hypothetical protein